MDDVWGTIKMNSRKERADDAALLRARELVASEQWKEALPLCEAAVLSAPELADGYELLGDVRCALRQWKPAARAYLAAIERAPRAPHLFQKLGDLQLRCSKQEDAAESYRYAAELEQVTSPRISPNPPLSDASAAYLDLMKDCLTFLLWGARDGPILELDLRRPITSCARLIQRRRLKNRAAPVSMREFGMDWPAEALTMIGKKRLDNIQQCVACVVADRIPGDLIEAGVWRGGATIFMRALLKAYGENERAVWVADSFRGLPPPSPKAYPADRGYDLSVWRSLAVSAEEVRANFQRFGLLDGQVKFLEGWFADTLPPAPIDRLSVLRLDGDLYESTMDSLVHLYPRLSPGGFAIVDDYYSAPPCRQAVDDYRRQHAISETIVKVDWAGAFWRKQ